MTMRKVALAVTLLATSRAWAQGKVPAASENGPTSTETQKAEHSATVTDPHKAQLVKEVQKLATPGPQHKALQPLIGKWNTTAKLWLGEKFPERSTGHAEVKSILSERFVEEKYDSTIWGQPFAAQGELGYDLRAQKYTIGWMDSWGTWITVAQGTADVTGHVFTLTTQDYDNPAGKTRPTKFMIVIDSNDHHTRKVFEKVNGKETLTMEIEYTRAK